jgi:hypothetical protein
LIYNKLRDLNAKLQGLMNFWDLFSNRKLSGPVPRGVDRGARLGPRWIGGDTDKMCGSTLPTRGTRALWVTSAR